MISAITSIALLVIALIDDQCDHQQRNAGLCAWHDGGHGHHQVQQVADPAPGLEAFDAGLVQGTDFDVIVIHGSGPFSFTSRSWALRSAFSSMPLVPSRRSSSATTWAGVRP